MTRPNLPPILNTKEYKSLVQKYKEEEIKDLSYHFNSCELSYMVYNNTAYLSLLVYTFVPMNCIL